MTDIADPTSQAEGPPFDDLPIDELERLTAKAEAQARYWIWRRHSLRLALQRARDARRAA